MSTVAQWNIWIIGCVVHVPAERVERHDILPLFFGQRDESKSQVRLTLLRYFLRFAHPLGFLLMNSFTSLGPNSRQTSANLQETCDANVAITVSPSRRPLSRRIDNSALASNSCKLHPTLSAIKTRG